MKTGNNLQISASPQTQPAKKLRSFASLALQRRSIYGRERRRHAGKELDAETGLYYYGARYLDPKTSRWLSGDPAMGEYIPSAPVNEEAKKRNGNLPGMGGVFNYANLHAYHYAGNNPVKYTDPDGRTNRPLENDEWVDVKKAVDLAVTNLDSIINELTDYASGASQSISNEIVENASHWLGINVNSKTKAQNFANDLSKIRNKLASLDINNFSWDDSLGERVALANSLTEHTKLAPDFFVLPLQGGLFTKSNTLVHEVSHFRSVLDTRDIVYDPNPSRRLVINSPQTAYKNADNWAFFYDGYVRERQKR